MTVLKTTAKVFLFCLGVSPLLSLSLFAQLTKLTDRDSFSEAVIQLGFIEISSDVQSEEAFSEVGVRFFGEAGSSPQFKGIVTFPGPPLTDTVLRNVPLGESSANSSLIIRFDRRDTAIAIANITESEITVTFNARDETGETLPQTGGGGLPKIQLGPKEHRALFLTEIHPSLLKSDFEGSVAITAGGLFVVTSLQTVNGIIVSSLPAGSTQK